MYKRWLQWRIECTDERIGMLEQRVKNLQEARKSMCAKGIAPDGCLKQHIWDLEKKITKGYMEMAKLQAKLSLLQPYKPVLPAAKLLRQNNG